MVSLNTTVRQMTEMSQQEIDRKISANKKQAGMGIHTKKHMQSKVRKLHASHKTRAIATRRTRAKHSDAMPGVSHTEELKFTNQALCLQLVEDATHSTCSCVLFHGI